MPKWCQKYRAALGLLKEAHEHQVSTLLYCLGEEAEDILEITGISDKHRKDYNKVLSMFDAFFGIRKNVIVERTKFKCQHQLPEEPAEQFITSLYNLAADCKYGALKGKMIRNRIVIGNWDISLLERLQMDPNLTLENVKTLRTSGTLLPMHLDP